MRQTFEHFLNTATVMKSPKPLSISIFDYLKRFDSGLRQLIKCFDSFNGKGLGHFFYVNNESKSMLA